MEEKVKEILKQNGYQVSDQATLTDIIKFINQSQTMIEMLEEEKILFLPKEKQWICNF